MGTSEKELRERMRQAFGGEFYVSVDEEYDGYLTIRVGTDAATEEQRDFVEEAIRAALLTQQDAPGPDTVTIPLHLAGELGIFAKLKELGYVMEIPAEPAEAEKRVLDSNSPLSDFREIFTDITPASQPRVSEEQVHRAIAKTQAPWNRDDAVYYQVSNVPALTRELNFALASAVPQREKVHETIGYETDYMRGRREMREEIASGDAPNPASQPRLSEEQVQKLSRMEVHGRTWVPLEQVAAQPAAAPAEPHGEREAILKQLAAYGDGVLSPSVVEVLGGDETDSVYQAALKIHNAGFELAHESAKCGHARANYRDPNYIRGVSTESDCSKCEFCEALAQRDHELILRGVKAGIEAAAELCKDALSTNDHHALCKPERIRAIDAEAIAQEEEGK